MLLGIRAYRRPANRPAARLTQSAMAEEMILPPCRYPLSAVDLARSTALARRLGTESRECYTNAYRAMALAPGTVYVEGLVASSVTLAAIPHGWLEIPTTGMLLDPTPGYCDGSSPTLMYFAGQRWTRGATLAVFRRQGSATFPLSDCPADGDEEGWRRAESECHGFRAAYHLERFGTPMCAEAELAEQRLIAQMSRWPQG